MVRAREGTGDIAEGREVITTVPASITMTRRPVRIAGCTSAFHARTNLVGREDHVFRFVIAAGDMSLADKPS